MISQILIDLDGVLTDFVAGATAVHRALGTEIDPTEYSLGLDDDAFWEPINAAEYAFWRDLPTLPWMDQLVFLASLYGEWSICTKPSNEPFCAAGKIMWLKKHFGSEFKRYTLAKHKYHLAKPGYVLIDDHDGNCARFNEHGGHAILFPQPWNANHALCDDRLGYVSRELEKLK